MDTTTKLSVDIQNYLNPVKRTTPCTRITLDLQKAATSVTVNVKRGDVGRRIRITLSDGGFPYFIPADCYAVLTGKKPDGNILYNHCDIENNTIVYEITEQTTAAAGRMNAEVKLYGSDDTLVTSSTFRLIIDGTVYDDAQVESSSEFSALTEMMSQMQHFITRCSHCAFSTVSSYERRSPRVFNGEITEYCYTEFDGMQLVCASTDVLTVKDLLGKTVTVVSDGEERTFTLTEENLNDRGAEDEWHKYIEITPMTVGGKPIAICAYGDSSVDGGETGITPGVYYLYVEDTFYTKVLNYLPEAQETEEVISTLHPKYLPNRRHYGEFPLTFTLEKRDDGKEYPKWSASMREVDYAYEKGMFISATSYDGDLLYPIVADPGVIYVFIELGNPFNVVYLTSNSDHI